MDTIKKSFTEKIWEKYGKPILLRISPTYKAVNRSEEKIAKLNQVLRQYRTEYKQTNILIKKASEQFIENDALLELYGNEISECNKLLRQYNKDLAEYTSVTEQGFEDVTGQNTEIHGYFEDLQKKMSSHDGLIKSITDLQKQISLHDSVTKSILDLQDIMFIKNEIEMNDGPKNEFLRSLDLEVDSDNLRKVKLLGNEIRFTDAWSFWCVLKELFINEEYYIEYETETPRILDCGAHIGMASIYSKIRYPNARITAFEPDPLNIMLLKQNLQSFGYTDVDVVQKAVGDKNEMVQFYRAPDMSMGGSITTRMEKGTRKLEEFSVGMCRLRDFIVNDKIDFLKLDIEGTEDTVLLDCEDCIQNVNYMFIEFHTGKDLSMARMSKILDVLDKNGFVYNIALSSSSQEKNEKRPFRHVKDLCTHLIYAKNGNW